MNDGAGATPARLKWEGIACLLITSVLWGVNWPILKFLLSELPPLSARAIAGMIGAAVMFGVAFVRGETLKPPAGELPRLAIAALLNFTAWMGFTTLSLIWLYASETVIIAYTLPIWTALLARPMLGERLSLERWLGMLLGLSGVGLLVFVRADGQIWTKLPGVALALIASVLFGLGAILSKRRPLRMPPVTAVAWQIALGTVPLFLGMFLERPSFVAVDVRGWLGLATSGVFVLGLGYITWFAALKRLPASFVTIGSLLVPVVGVLTSAAALGEPLGWRECGALALALAGVAIATRR
jgi:probable blue pigment (indigoidine) exporter